VYTVEKQQPFLPIGIIMSRYKALLSVYSQDRVGLISQVTGHLFDRGANLGDTTFAILGKGGEFTSILEIPGDLSEQDLMDGLHSVSGLEDAKIDIKRFSIRNSETPPKEITHRIKCEGEDQPGLLARLSEVFINFDSNIVRLKSDQMETPSGNRFITRFSVNIPKERADNCLAALGNTAEGLGQSLSFEAVKR
jgi:glycine cleavage system transcriptional repressor